MQVSMNKQVNQENDKSNLASLVQESFHNQIWCDLLASVGLVNKNGCKGQH